MGKRDDIAALRALAEIRAAQSNAARARLARLLRAVTEAEAQAEAGRDRQAQRSQAWTTAASGPRIDLAMAQVWGQALVQGEGDVGRLAEAVGQAVQRCEMARDQAAAATARQDAAEAVCGAAVRRERRRRDELALADAADRVRLGERVP